MRQDWITFLRDWSISLRIRPGLALLPLAMGVVPQADGDGSVLMGVEANQSARMAVEGGLEGVSARIQHVQVVSGGNQHRLFGAAACKQASAPRLTTSRH